MNQTINLKGVDDISREIVKAGFPVLKEKKNQLPKEEVSYQVSEKPAYPFSGGISNNIKEISEIVKKMLEGGDSQLPGEVGYTTFKKEHYPFFGNVLIIGAKDAPGEAHSAVKKVNLSCEFIDDLVRRKGLCLLPKEVDPPLPEKVEEVGLTPPGEVNPPLPENLPNAFYFEEKKDLRVGKEYFLRVFKYNNGKEPHNSFGIISEISVRKPGLIYAFLIDHLTKVLYENGNPVADGVTGEYRDFIFTLKEKKQREGDLGPILIGGVCECDLASGSKGEPLEKKVEVHLGKKPDIKIYIEIDTKKEEIRPYSSFFNSQTPK